MHPINNKNFGNNVGKIAIKFFDGSIIKTGWIVAQTGSVKYKITDGTITKIASLAQTNADLNALLNGTGPNSSNRANLCTIEITPYGGSTENIKTLTSAQAVTIQGSFITWKLGTSASSNGQGTIGIIVAPPVLGTLSLSNGAATVDINTTINILGATANSAITGTVPDGMILNSAARTISGSPIADNVYNFTLTETLLGAVGSPKTNNITITVAAPDGTLTINGFSLTLGGAYLTLGV